MKALDHDISIMKTDRIGRISIYITSHLDFFKDGVIVKDNGECLYFTRPSLDYKGTIYNSKIIRNNHCVIGFISEIPIGHYDFEDDGDEDELTIYYG